MGGQLRSGGGYILGMDSKEFYNVLIRDLRVSMDHQVFLEELKGDGPPGVPGRTQGGRIIEKPQVLQWEDLLSHCRPEEGPNV